MNWLTDLRKSEGTVELKIYLLRIWNQARLFLLLCIGIRDIDCSNTPATAVAMTIQGK